MPLDSSGSDPWSLAQARYMVDLKDEEKVLFRNASVETLFLSTSAAQAHHEQNSKSRALSAKLEPLISAISQFGSALDVYSSIYPLAMGPIWGSIRIVLHLATAFEKYFDKLIEMLVRIGDVLPRCRVYESLFPTHGRLLQAISMAYLDIIYFCMDAKTTLRRFQSSTTRHFTVKLVWKDFNKEFDRILGEFRSHVKNVEKEAGISNMIEASQERDIMRADRIEDEFQKKIAKRDRLMAQLQSVRYIDKHLKERRRRIGQTGTWLLETQQFKQWMENATSSCLWCYGIPGSGKTVLASALIDLLAKDVGRADVTVEVISSEEIVRENVTTQDAVIVYYYCDFSDAISLELGSFMRAIIRQLLEGIIIPSTVQKQIDTLFRSGDRDPTTEEFITIFKDIGKYIHRVFTVIDGLDECRKETQSNILLMTHGMARVHGCSKFIFTSREEEIITISLRDYQRLNISASNNSEDIDAFIEASVKCNIDSGKLVIDQPWLKLEVLSRLKEGAHGMFLWVHFQLLDLCEAPTHLAIEEVLRNLPIGMAATYKRILQKISKSQVDTRLAQTIFPWIISAKRPLQLGELSEAVAFGPEDTSYNAEQVPRPSRLIPACGNLVILDENDNTVRLAHHTVQQFLLQEQLKPPLEDFHFERIEADICTGAVCVAYLSFSDFERQVSLHGAPRLMLLDAMPSPDIVVDRTTHSLGLRNNISPEIFRIGRLLRNSRTKQKGTNFDLARHAMHKSPLPSLHEKFILLDYVIDYWLEHTRDLDVLWREHITDQTKPRELAFAKLFSKFKKLVSEAPLPFDLRPWVDERGAFRWAIQEGHILLLRCLDEIERYYNELTDDGQLVILDAVQSNHLEVVKYLVAEAWFEEIQVYRILFYAIENTIEDVVEFLTKYVSFHKWGPEALLKACRNGNVKVVQILLGPEPLLSSELGKLMLEFALENCCEDIQVLIIRALDNPHQCILAAEMKLGPNKGYLLENLKKGHEKAASLLINIGADVTERDENGVTALHLAATFSNDNLVAQILSQTVDVFAIDNYGYTALHRAASYGHTSIVRQLLERGAAIYAVSSDQETPLLLAAKNGHTSTVHLLLDRGANIFRTNGYEFTALHLAASNGHDSTVELLLEWGADISASNGHNMTALLSAAENGNTSTVELLLNHGAKLLEVDKHMFTALHFAASNGHDSIVDLLLERGADISAITGGTEGFTTLHLAARGGHRSTVQLLINRGTDISKQNYKWQTAMDMAALDGHDEIFELLLEKMREKGIREDDEDI